MVTYEKYDNNLWFWCEFELISVTKDLKAMVLKLEGRVAALEKNKPAAAAAAPAPAKAAAPADDDDDDDVDLFGSDEGKISNLLL